MADIIKVILIILVLGITFIRTKNERRIYFIPFSILLLLLILIKYLSLFILVKTIPLISSNNALVLIFVYQPIIYQLLSFLVALFVLKKLNIEQYFQSNIHINYRIFFIVLIVMVAGKVISLHFYKPSFPNQITSLLINSPLLLFLFSLDFIILTPIIEEFIYRGILFSEINNNTSFPLAIIASSIIWGLMHTSQFIGVFIFGILLAFLYERTKSLLSCIIVHSIVNTIYVISIIY